MVANGMETMNTVFRRLKRYTFPSGAVRSGDGGDGDDGGQCGHTLVCGSGHADEEQTDAICDLLFGTHMNRPFFHRRLMFILQFFFGF